MRLYLRHNIIGILLLNAHIPYVSKVSKILALRRSRGAAVDLKVKEPTGNPRYEAYIAYDLGEKSLGVYQVARRTVQVECRRRNRKAEARTPLS